MIGRLLLSLGFLFGVHCQAMIGQEMTSGITPNPVLSQLSQYELVKPVPQTSASSDFHPLLDSESKVFPDALSYKIRAFGKDFHLSLQKNKDLLAPDYVELRLDNSDPAAPVVERRSTDSARITNCFYRGSVIGDENSYVALSACSGLRGVISAHNELLSIEPSHFATASFDDAFYTIAAVIGESPSPTNRAPTRHLHSSTTLPVSTVAALEHVVYRDAELTQREAAKDAAESRTAARCGVADPDHDHSDAGAQQTTRTFPGLQSVLEGSDVDTVRLFVANDNKRFQSYGEGTEADTLAIVNLVSQFYSATKFSAPVRVTLVGQMTFKNGDPYTVRQGGDGSGVSVMAGDGLLYTWLGWHYNPSNNLPSHNSGQLMSGLMFEDGIRGLAGVGSMCSTQSGSITQMTSNSLNTRAMISAHETGHTLGMEHDGVSNSCPGRGFIMQTVTGEATTFSTCSINSANAFLDSGARCMSQPAAINQDPNPISSDNDNNDNGASKANPVPSPSSSADVDACLLPARYLLTFSSAIVGGAIALSALFFFIGRRTRFCPKAPAGPSRDPCEKQHIKLVEVGSSSDSPRDADCQPVTVV
jgi:disintegrin and metalloproteinase domain-containing protein 9